MLTYLIVCPLVFLAGFVDSIAGGGGLISLPAYMLTGIPVHNVVATNKMSSCMGTAISTGKLAKAGYIPWKQALCSILFAIAGSVCGAKAALLIPDRSFRIIMLIVVPLTAAYVLFGKGLTSKKEPYPQKKTILITILIAFFIGIYDGIYGPGTGTFLILLLTSLARMDIKEANGVTKAINFTTNLSALTVFLLNGKVLFPLGPIAGCFNIAGNYMGIRFFTKGGVKSVKPIMIFILCVFFLKLLTELL